MSTFVRDYVNGCALCQATKIQNQPPHVGLVPNNIPERPFQVITSDFIPDLLACQGFDSIAVVVD